MSGRDNFREDKNVTEKQISQDERRTLEQRYTTSISTDAIAAAERAIRKQAEKDAIEAGTMEEQKLREKEARLKVAQIREKEAQKKVEQINREILEKQRAVAEAKAKAAQKTQERVKTELQAGKNESVRSIMAENIQAKLDEEKPKTELKKLEKETKGKLQRQEEELARKEKEKREREEARRRLEEEKRRLQIEKRRLEAEKKKEQERIKAEAAAARREAKRAAQEAKNERARQKIEEKKKKEERDLLIAKQRAIQKAKREAERKAEKAREEAERRERKARIKAERAEKQKLRKERKFAKKQAEKGGGLVNVHGTVVQTEIQPVAAFSWKALLGISRRKEIKEAVSAEKKQELIEENERLTAEARAAAAQLAEARSFRRMNSKPAEKLREFLAFCDARKRPLLTGFGIVLVAVICGAGVINFCTAYQYSYNGAQLGYVKSKEDVLQVTEMVQRELTEEKNIAVVVDANDDITFDRKFTLNKDVVIDSADDVLRRLTYMGDLNVKAWGIYLDGRKVGAVENKQVAADVLKKIEDKYASHKEGSVIKEAAIVEDIKIRKSNTDLQDLMNADQMVEKLCTSGIKESVHTVVRGETLASIAKDHNLAEEDILKDNPDVDRQKLEVGSTITLHETAPIMTVRIVEERTHTEKTDYKTIKKKDDDLYEGFTEVDQKGKKGLAEKIDKTTSINGEVVETVNLKNEVKEKPVDKIVRVGTKERPPTVGSGTYIWPAYSGSYTVTSEFKWRWGRQHEGMDLGCHVGTDVLASDGGTVVHAGYMGGYGLLVIIDHQDGVQTYYGHNSALLVHVGDKVFQGQHIAEAGSTGRSTGPHIHFGVKDHGSFKNPRNYLP
ncbi:MAG: peptidoglycan DD-metalloendopeptidase family protein [Clostridia bacterium]|nr:peptidoglycan DD-metalloendopeptidase family protein [Clostridia bacterium]